jgi:hypothetical protein
VKYAALERRLRSITARLPGPGTVIKIEGGLPENVKLAVEGKLPENVELLPQRPNPPPPAPPAARAAVARARKRVRILRREPKRTGGFPIG